MKSAKILIVPTLLLFVLARHSITVQAGPVGRNLLPTVQKSTFVSLEDLEAEYYSANKIVSIQGKIKNVSMITLRGYITLYLLSASGSVLSSIELPLNDHRPLREGESVDFDTAVNVANISGAYRVSVDFTRE